MLCWTVRVHDFQWLCLNDISVEDCMHRDMISTVAVSMLWWAGSKQHIEVVSRLESSVPAVNRGGALTVGVIMK